MDHHMLEKFTLVVTPLGCKPDRLPDCMKQLAIVDAYPWYALVDKQNKMGRPFQLWGTGDHYIVWDGDQPSVIKADYYPEIWC